MVEEDEQFQGNIPLSKRTPSGWDFSTTLEEAVTKYINENPDKHQLAQHFGDYLMNTKFSNVDTFKVEPNDVEGQKLLYQEIIKRIEFYGIDADELYEWEIDILEKEIGPTWKTKLF